MEYMGVKCRKLFSMPEKQNGFYAVIPLNVLSKLGEKNAKSKMLALLYCYGRMNNNKWFTISGDILQRYGISPRQKRRILLSYEQAGILKLKKEPGKSYRIKLINKQ